MKRLKKVQLGHWCQFCAPKTNRTVYVGAYFDGFACASHQKELQIYEDSRRDDGHMSEADYQTWGRL